jgi:hypothetical protein
MIRKCHLRQRWHFFWKRILSLSGLSGGNPVTPAENGSVDKHGITPCA